MLVDMIIAKYQVPDLLIGSRVFYVNVALFSAGFAARRQI